MGSAVEANCECGYHASLLIGGGMASFETVCLFPCLCRECRAVVEANLLDRPVSCPECGAADPVAYDDPTLSEGEGEGVVAEWNVEDKLGRVLTLSDASHLCPRCDRFSLTFAGANCCWD